MMSSASMQSGARARDSRKRPGLSGWRALTCPNESTTPSRARMRFAVTSSSLSRSSLVIAFPFWMVCPELFMAGLVPAIHVFLAAQLRRGCPARPGIRDASQDEAHRAEGAELVGVDQDSAFLDSKRVARAPQ